MRGFRDPASFVASLCPPRAVILMVAAGAPVDDTLALLAPHLAPGDVLIDGGNSFFEDTERRLRELASQGIHFLGMGISGGEAGARHGPSLMPGGAPEAFAAVEEVLRAIAARGADGAPCVAFCGKGGAGHFVKMVHNGMEYADMQLLCEAHDVLSTLCGLSHDEEAVAFEACNAPGADTASFLLEISARILRTRDAEDASGRTRLLDVVQDVTSSKGTGKWTVEQAAELRVPVPCIAAGLEARYLSERAGDDPDADRALAAHSAAVLEMVNSDDAVDEDGACKELRVLWPLYECTAIALRAAHDALAQEQRRSSELRRQLAQARGAATLRRAGLQPSGDDDDDDDDAAAEADHALPAPAPLLTVATDARAWADSVLLELHAPHENGGICGGGGGGGGGGAAAALQEHSAKRQSSRIRRTHLDGTEDAAAGLAALQDE